MLLNRRGVKVVFEGVRFDSKAELARYKFLLEEQKAGKIGALAPTELIAKPTFVLVPAQRVKTYQGGSIVLRPMTYTADFSYFDYIKEIPVVEDLKGFKTAEFTLKRKLMAHLFPDQLLRIVKFRKSKSGEYTFFDVDE